MATFVPESTFQTEDPTRLVHQQQPQPQLQHQQALQLQQQDYNQYNNLTSQSHVATGQFSSYHTDPASAYTKPTFTSHVTNHFPKLEPKLENVYDNAYSNQTTGFNSNSTYPGLTNYTASNSSYQYFNQSNNTISNNDINCRNQQQFQATSVSPDSEGYYYEASSNFMPSSSSSWSNRPV